MLKISDAQLEALAAVRAEPLLIEYVFNFARAELSECVEHMSDAQLHSRIREDMDAARGFGINNPQRQVEFIGLSLMGGDFRFYLEPDARAHFEGEGANAEEQTRLMLEDVKRMALEKIG